MACCLDPPLGKERGLAGTEAGPPKMEARDRDLHTVGSFIYSSILILICKIMYTFIYSEGEDIDIFRSHCPI